MTDHDGHGHSHGVSADADRRWLAIALALIICFMAGEVVAGLVAGSLALLSDAAHMLTDAFSIGLALVAMRLAARPARGTFTFGLKRVEILSAQANGLTLLLLSVWLGYEAVHRLVDPPQVNGSLVLYTALAGIVVNLAATWCLARANRSSLNVEGAFQHILTDLFAFIGTAVAGGAILLAGWLRADALASVVVVVLILKAGIGLLRASGRIFLEAAPSGTHPDEVGDHMARHEGVAEVHDLHLWEITSNQPALSAHVLVQPGLDCHRLRRGVEDLLLRQYDISHTTLQVDHLGEGTGSTLLRVGEPADRHDHGAEEPTHGPVHRPGPHEH